MKRLIFAFLMLSITPIGFAKETPSQSVEAAVNALTKALESGEEKALKAITSPELTYGHSSGNLENQTQFIHKLTSGQSDFVTIKLLNQTVQVNGDVALVRHDLDATTNDSGKPGTVYLGVLLVFQNTNNQWKLLGRQAFRYPKKNKPSP